MIDSDDVQAFSTTQLCCVCGTRASVLTVYRVFCRQLIKSDECAECNAFLNAHTKPPKVEPISVLDKCDVW